MNALNDEKSTETIVLLYFSNITSYHNDFRYSFIKYHHQHISKRKLVLLLLHAHMYVCFTETRIPVTPYPLESISGTCHVVLSAVCMEPFHKSFMSTRFKYWEISFSLKNNDQLSSEFGTCHDRVALLECAKLRSDWITIVHVRGTDIWQDLDNEPIKRLHNGPCIVFTVKLLIYVAPNRVT